ncbi:MAG: acyl--CoA ligase [Propionibacteriaceae bacterium]|jgi:long-chain acyl-CoA synthetase|nr:acyl--CoA ligase [Propionibacteriaceae bacterium]
MEKQVPDSATDRPWLKYYGDMPADIEVPQVNLYELFAAAAKAHPDNNAIAFMGTLITYRQLLAEVDHCAEAFTAMGVKAGDSATLVMPNIPNTPIMFYALNKIGARVALAHPLSSAPELAHYLEVTNSKWAVTVDMFYAKFRDTIAAAGVEKLLVTHIPDFLKPLLKVGFRVTKGRKIPAVPKSDPLVVEWKNFLAAAPRGSEATAYVRPQRPEDGAVVLFSGGTTALPKGIELSSFAFNALKVSVKWITGLTEADSVLTIMPLFHGFGLGLCIHTTLSTGACSILVPEVSAKSYIDNLLKYHPTFIPGVPTLFESLLRHPSLDKVRFDNLVGAYSGGDSLTPDLKHRFDARIKAQGAKVELLEGYGLTETVTTCVLSPQNAYREGAMGVPQPGILAKIIAPDTTDELPYGETGEICVTGPTLMNQYLGDPEATASTLRRHPDGRLWCHTGDIGSMDSDGYLYFVNRLKRIIKVSGVAVYPMQVEQVLEAHPLVDRACVIGVPDDYQMARVRAYVIPAAEVIADDAAKETLLEHCRQQLNKWSAPRELEFRDELPRTLVGKIDYRALEREAADM